MDKLKLEVQLGLIDKILKPLKAITAGSGATAKALQEVRGKLKELNDEQSRISKFNKTVESAREASAAYKKQKEALSELTDKLKTAKEAQAAMKGPIAVARREYDLLRKQQAQGRDYPGLGYQTYVAEKNLKALEARYGTANNAVRRFKDELKSETKELDAAKQRKTTYSDTLKRITTELKEAGVGTKNLTERNAKLTASIAAANAVAEKHGKIMQRMSAAQASYDNRIANRNKIAMAGATTTATGAAMGMPIIKAIKDYANFEDAMMGVARQVDGAKDANGRYTQTYYEMGKEIKALSEQLPLTSIQFANIVEAAARMGIQGKENLIEFAKTAAKSSIAFDMPVDVLSDQMAKLADLYKIPIKEISGLGDAINYLDDNATSKGADIIDVMQRIAGITESVGMNYKQSAALASTFLSMGDTAETAATASKAMIMRLSNAPMLATAKRYAEGLDMIKLNAHKLQDGMTKDAVGTLKNVMDAINALPKNKQIEATSRLFGVEYGPAAAKLAQNMDKFKAQLDLVNDAKAKDSMDREAISRTQALSAQYVLATNAVSNLSTELGQTLKPALVDILQSIAYVMRGIRAWTQEHPQLTASLFKGVAIIAAVVTGLGALMLAAAAVLGPFAVLKYGMAMLSIKGLGLISMITNVTRALMWLTSFLMLNPIGLTITAIVLSITLLAGSAYLIYKNWAPIKKFLLDIWDSATVGFNKMVDWIINKLAFLKPLLAAAGLAVGTAQAEPVKIDNRPPITPASMRAAGAPVQTNTITIHAAPGMNEQQVAQQVARELEKLNREAAAKSRSRLTDKE